MKKILFQFALLLALSAMVFSCKDDSEDNPTPNPTDTTVVLSGNLETQTLDASKKYLIKGYVFVQSGKTLTIPAGTVLYGDKASKGTLVINRGGRLVAEGTAEKPIVFTSKLAAGERDKGDWGGIIILGNANVNQNNPAIEGVSPAVNFGTQNSTANDTESSGSLKFVRVEFAGIALSPNNEINGITFGGVGSGTTLENVQVSYSGDDAFEWFGGTINGKNLVAFATWDDDFDTDFGYTGKIQFGLVVRDPFSADQSGSNAFESDNDASGTTSLPLTAPVFSNITVFGPRFDSTSSISANYQHAAHFRRRTAASLFNSVLTGFPTGLRLDGKTTFDNYTAETGEVKNNLLISLGNRTAPKPFMGGTNITDDEVKTYFTAGNAPGYVAYTNQLNYSTFGIENTLFMGKTPTYPSNPNFSVASGSLGSGAAFTSAKLSTFFQNVAFIGAFGSSDWTDSWTEFDPKNKTY